MITSVLLEFRDTQDLTALNIEDKNISVEEVNVIVIEILSWLKLEHKRGLWLKEGKKTKQKPMKLNMQYSWCKTLEKLVYSGSLFSDTFVVKENQLFFREDIDEGIRVNERRNAYDNYNPDKIM